jgi:hypothetical protein
MGGGAVKVRSCRHVSGHMGELRTSAPVSRLQPGEPATVRVCEKIESYAPGAHRCDLHLTVEAPNRLIKKRL